MTLKFEKIPGKDQSPIWNVIHESHFIGRVEPDETGRLGFSTSRNYVALGVWLTEIVAFIRQQSGEAAPATVDPALEKRVAELERLVAPIVERQKGASFNLASTISLMFHDDNCGELLDASGLCPNCKFHPDMQSTGFRDVSTAGVDKLCAQGRTFLGRYRTPITQ